MPQDSLSKRLHEPSGIVMLSGGIDSVAVLKKVLEETDEKIYAHHIHIKNHEGINNIRRYKAEALALRKIIPYMKKNFRDFHYSESTIDTRQICNLRKGVFDEEDEDLVRRTFQIKDATHYYMIGGILANVTNSSFVYTGDMHPPIYYVKESPYRNHLNFFEGMKYFNAIFDGSVYPHKGEVKRLFWDRYCKKENVEYLGPELMKMAWYCRNPIERNGKIFSCNSELGLDHIAVNDKTGEVFKCMSCSDVSDAILNSSDVYKTLHASRRKIEKN